MKESVAIAKEADTKKDFSPTRSDKSIHRVRNEPERQLGSLRGVIGNIRRDGCTPSVDSIATELRSMPSTAQRASVLLALQQTHGNQYVQRVVAGVQAKLKVGQPGDIYEQEADRVAEQVMRMPEPKLKRQAEEKEEKTIQTKSVSDQIMPMTQRNMGEEESVLAKAIDKKPYVGQSLQKQLAQSRGDEGSSLPEHSRSFMESRFGTDFSNVRVHTDSQATEMAKTLNARAFTSGKDIYFGAGRYAPGTTSGDRLLAHELTHVIQQRSLPATQEVSQSLSRLGTDKSDLIYRQPADATGTEVKAPSKPVADIAPGVMELKRESKFDPKEGPIAKYFEDKKTGYVNVSFGRIAGGTIKVTKTRSGNYNINKEPIPLNRPIFAQIGEGAAGFKPSLILSAKEGQISGYIGIGRKGDSQALVSQFKEASNLIGLAGFDLSKLSKITNKLEGGVLHLGLKGVPITLGGVFSGTITLEATNEDITFEGNANIKVKGLASGNLELNRSKEGLITGKAEVELQLPKNFSGNLIVIWDGQVVTGEGKVGYEGEKFSGEIILKLMEKSQAEQLEEGAKAPAGKVALPGPKKSKSKKGKADYVVFGEGDLTFAFTEWLAGTAHVIVGPKGYITVIGEIAPQKEIELFPQKDYNKKLFKVEARASYGIPVVGNIFIFANVGMDAFANIGPGKLYNISVKGTYSTNPKKKQDFTIQGSLNISAAAGMRLRGEAGAGLEVLAHDIKAGAGINGIAGIRGYAEATPKIGYREKAKEGEDKKGEFFIRGELEIAAQPFLGLSGDLFVEIDAPWWSPVPDKRWTWPLGNKEWPIGGSLGMNASVDYVFGSKEPPAVEIQPAEFSADKFLTDLYSDKAKAKSGGAEKKKGTWAEKNTKGAEPPKAGKKGGAQVGEAPKLPPAQPKVKPGGAKKVKKPVDPNVRTAEGKSVKEYQEEASKKEKKPEAKGPQKGTGKEEVAEKDTAKKAHDEQMQEGLAALDAVTKRYAEKGATKEELKVAVKAVRRKFKVFESISIVDGVKTWDYKYVASDGHQGGPPKAEGAPNAKEAEKTKVGDYVSYQRDKMILLVTEVNVHTEHGDMVRARAGKAEKRKTSFLLPYNRYGEVWEILAIKKPTYKPFIAFGGPGEGGQVIIDTDNLDKSGTSAYASDEDKADMGFGGKYKHLGHLVANVFTGPGTYKSGNTVAMTHAANLTKQGMKGIESPIQKDIENNFAVYKYAARSKDMATPPKQIEVIAMRLFPSTSPPPGVPTKKIVDNK